MCVCEYTVVHKCCTLLYYLDNRSAVGAMANSGYGYTITQESLYLVKRLKRRVSDISGISTTKLLVGVISEELGGKEFWL